MLTEAAWPTPLDRGLQCSLQRWNTPRTVPRYVQRLQVAAFETPETGDTQHYSVSPQVALSKLNLRGAPPQGQRPSTSLSSPRQSCGDGQDGWEKETTVWNPKCDHKSLEGPTFCFELPCLSCDFDPVSATWPLCMYWYADTGCTDFGSSSSTA